MVQWNKIETVPYNQRVIIAQNGELPSDEMALAWLDRMDGQFYYAPQGGLSLGSQRIGPVCPMGLIQPIDLSK